MEREYELDDEDADSDADSFPDDDTASLAPSLLSTTSHTSRLSRMAQEPPDASLTRSDFDAIMDDFLDRYEVVGSHMRQALGGANMTGAEKLDVLRRAVDGEGNRERVLRGTETDVQGELPKYERVRREEDEGGKWDVDTILCALRSPHFVSLPSALEESLSGLTRSDLYEH